MAMPVVDGSRIVHLDQYIWIFGMNYAGQTASCLIMFMEPGGHAMSVVWVPALLVVQSAVEHKEGCTALGQGFQPIGGRVDVLVGGSAERRVEEPLLADPH